MGIQRRRRRTRHLPTTDPVEETASAVEAVPTGVDAAAVLHRPSPQDLAHLPGAFALTAAVLDPEDPVVPERSVAEPDRPALEPERDDGERGLRGLIGSGTSQVSVAAAMRARDASRPRPADLAAAESDLVMVRRGWVPREELPRPGRR